MPCTNKDCGLVERLSEGQTLPQIELAFRRLVLIRMIRVTGGSLTKAAEMLNIHRNTMTRNLQECRIEDEWIDRVKQHACVKRAEERQRRLCSMEALTEREPSLEIVERERDPKLTRKQEDQMREPVP